MRITQKHIICEAAEKYFGSGAGLIIRNES